MHRDGRSRRAIAAAVVLSTLTAACAGRPSTCEVRDDVDEGFRSLFDGTRGSLEAWVQAGPGGFTLTDECALRSHGGLGLYYVDEELRAPFTLQLEFQKGERDNSGIFVGFPDPSGDPWVAVEDGHEIQLGPDDDPGGGTGAVYGERPADRALVAAVERPPGEWNHLEIEAGPQHLVVRLNGVRVNAHLARRPNERQLSGHVGLQNHGETDTVLFRRIQIRGGA